MADNANTQAVAEGTTNTNTPEVVDTNTNPTPEKTFTQAEVDRIVTDRLSRERKNAPSAEDMKAFKEWKKNSQTDAEKYSAMEADLKAAQAELAALKNQQSVIKAECKAEFAEFVADKVAKMGDDFDGNLAEFKKSNPQYFGETKVVKLNSSPKLTGGTSTTVADIMAIKDGKERRRAIAANMHLFKK